MKRTLNELAESLGLSPQTLERWIRQGRIPIRKSGEACLFNPETLKQWAESNQLSYSLKPGKPRRSETAVPLLAALQRGGILYELEGDRPDGLLKSAVDRLDFLSAPTRATLYQRLLDREAMTSTGIGQGVAIPHPRTPLEDGPSEPTIITAFPREPVDYNAIDEQPVFVLFMLLSPTVQVHLQLLSRLSFCLREKEFVDFLRARPELEALLYYVESLEAHLERAEHR